MKEMTLHEFHDECRAQAKSSLDIVFVCPMCKTLQSANDLISAGAGNNLDEVERYLGYACVGRFKGAGTPRREPDGHPCDWTLGGLFKLHRLEVITPDGVRHPRFELATLSDAHAHLARSENGCSAGTGP